MQWPGGRTLFTFDVSEDDSIWPQPLWKGNQVGSIILVHLGVRMASPGTPWPASLVQSPHLPHFTCTRNKNPVDTLTRFLSGPWRFTRAGATTQDKTMLHVSTVGMVEEGKGVPVACNTAFLGSVHSVGCQSVTARTQELVCH